MYIKKSFSAFFIGSMLLLTIASCKKDEHLNPIIEAPSVVKFAMAGAANASYSYFVTNTTGTPWTVPVGFTTVSNKDRTIVFSYTSSTGAVAGTQYNAPQTITIPAGKVEDSLRIQGLFAGYPTGRRDTLRVAISSPDAPTADFNKTYTLVMQKYCNVVLTDLQGTYTNTRETNSTGGSPYGPYSSTVTLTPIAGSTTTATAVFSNFWDYGVNVTGTINWTNPANFTVTIPLQNLGVNYAAGQPITVRTSANQPNSFSSCDQSFNLTVDFIINNYPAAGQSAYYAQNYKINIRR